LGIWGYLEIPDLRYLKEGTMKECHLRLNFQELLNRIGDKSIANNELLSAMKEHSEVLADIIEGTASSKPAIRYGCSKALMSFSAEYPEELYPYMDSFISLLDSKYRILTWNASAIIANLAQVDRDKKFDRIFEKYYSFLDDPYMVTVANVVGNSAKIALAKPYLLDRIVNELLRVENISVTPHMTEECKRVIAQHTIEAFDTLFDKTKDKDRVFLFVKEHLDSSRKTLKISAENFIKKRSAEPIQN
jgi:hypothetical protein